MNYDDSAEVREWAQQASEGEYLATKTDADSFIKLLECLAGHKLDKTATLP